MTRTTLRTTSGGGASRKGWRWRDRLGVLLLIAVCAAGFAAVHLPTPALAVEHDEGAGGGYNVPWWTADSGGNHSSSGGHSLRGTIGQPDAAVVTAAAGGYALHGGFWRSAPLQSLTIQPLADQTVQVAGTVSLQVIVTNLAGGALHYSAAGLPPGLQIDPATGLISGQLAANSAGIYAVTVTVTNERGISVQTTFTFTVTGPALPSSLYLPLVSN